MLQQRRWIALLGFEMLNSYNNADIDFQLFQCTYRLSKYITKQIIENVKVNANIVKCSCFSREREKLSSSHSKVETWRVMLVAEEWKDYVDVYYLNSSVSQMRDEKVQKLFQKEWEEKEALVKIS